MDIERMNAARQHTATLHEGEGCRVAVLLESELLDVRVREVIALLRAARDVRLVWAGLAPPQTDGSRTPRIPRSIRWLMWADRQVRAAAFGAETYDRLSDLYPDLPVLTSAEWHAALQRGPISSARANPDHPEIVVLLSPYLCALELAREAGVEVWWFDADGGYTATPLEGLSAVSNGVPVSRVRLRATAPFAARTQTLGTSEHRTHPGSPTVNGTLLRYGAIRVFDDALQRIGQRERIRAVGSQDGGTNAVMSNSGLLERPVAARQVLPLLGRALSTAVRTRFGDRSDDVQWSIGIGAAANVRWDSGRLGRVDWLRPPEDRFYADPFLVQRGGSTWLFMEVLRYADRKGFIAAVNASDRDSWREPIPVLEQPFHLSFPCIVEEGADVFMLPEQVQSGELTLYRSHGFPEDWRPHATLLSGVEAADPVLLRYDGYWWLFFSSARYGSHDNNLQLYFSERLEGPYARHPMSPIRESLLGARMAGRIFAEAGRLIRPAQDCRAEYGDALVFFDIRTLTPESYREERLALLSADRGADFGMGTHSYSRTPSTVAVDGFRYRRPRRQWLRAGNRANNGAVSWPTVRPEAR